MGLKIEFAETAARTFKNLLANAAVLPPGAPSKIAVEFEVFAKKVSSEKGSNWKRKLIINDCFTKNGNLTAKITLPFKYSEVRTPQSEDVVMTMFYKGPNPKFGEDLMTAYKKLLENATEITKRVAAERRDKISLGTLNRLAKDSGLLPNDMVNNIRYVIEQCNPKGDLYKVSQALQKVNKTAKELGIPLEIKKCYLGAKEAPTLTLGLNGMADAVQNVEISKYRGNILPTIAEDLEAAARKLATQHTAQKSIIEQETQKALDYSAIEKYFA